MHYGNNISVPSPVTTPSERVSASTVNRWLMLVHQVPPKPDYLRVKVRRRLDRLGAFPLKNSVYLLPLTAGTTEDFQWLLREIVADGGEGSICEATFIEGMSDAQLTAAFHRASTQAYDQIASAAAELGAVDERETAGASSALTRLRRRLDETLVTDILGAPGRDVAERALADAAARLSARRTAGGFAGELTHAAAKLRGRTWVTRADVHVDRIASAWLIRGFIDPDAHFRFVTQPSHTPATGEVRFDMFEAEYTHQGDSCTFETLLDRFDLHDPALQAVGEIVHDIDLKDEKFGRAEVAGVERLVGGIVAAHASDDARLTVGATFFSALHASFAATLSR